MIAVIPVLVAVVGLLLYALASSSKVQEVGRLMFFAGLFVVVLQQAERTMRVF